MKPSHLLALMSPVGRDHLRGHESSRRPTKRKRNHVTLPHPIHQNVPCATTQVGGQRLVAGPRAALVAAVVRHHRVADAECPLVHGLHRAQSVVDLLEVGPVRRRVVPAIVHDSIDIRWTVLRSGQQLVGADEIYDLLIVTVEVRPDAVAEDLPQEDAERPDVALCSEGSVE